MTIYPLILIALLNQASFSGTRITMSLYALDLGASPFAVGVLMSIFAMCSLLFAISIGKLADRTSPRMLMIVSSLLHVGALSLPLMFPGIPALFVMALILGVSHPLFLIPLEATVGGIGETTERVKNYSLIAMGWSAANFSGPIIAGFSIDLMSHGHAFLVLNAVVVVPTLMLYFMPALFVRARKHAGKQARGGVFDLWRMAPVRSTLIASAIIGSAHDMFQFYFPIYGRSIELSASAIGTINGMVAAAAFTIRGFLPRLIRRFSESQTLTGAVLIAASAFALLPFSGDPYVLAAIAFVLGLGVGCANPTTMSLLYALTPQARIAEVIGIHKSLRNSTQIAIPLVFGSVGGVFGFTAVFLSNAVILAMGTLFVRKAGRSADKPSGK